MSNTKKVTSTDTQETPVESEVVQETVQETAVEQAEEVKEAPSQVVYVGPTIFGVVVQNTVFKNGLSDGLKNAIQEEPVIANLLVPATELAEAMRKITNKQGALYISYDKVTRYKKGE